MTRCRHLALVAWATCTALCGFASAAETKPQPLPRHIGVLLGARSPDSSDVQAFRQGLREAGYTEGQNVTIEWRAANGDYSRAPGLAAELVERRVDVLVVESTPAAQAAKAATSTIPIVMAIVADPVGSGLVAALAHPGGNITGVSLMATELNAKRLQLLKETIPQLTRVAVLWNPDTPFHTKVMEELKAAAAPLSLVLSFADAKTAAQFSSAFAKIRQAHAQALYVIQDGFFFTQRAAIIEQASRAKLPAIYGERDFVKAGALMSYGPSVGDLYRRAAGYVDQILRGARPSDLSIEQPTKFEFVVNLRTAKALGLTMPQSVLLQADEVIR